MGHMIWFSFVVSSFTGKIETEITFHWVIHSRILHHIHQYLLFYRHMTRSLGLWNQKNYNVSQKEQAFFMDSSGIHPVDMMDESFQGEVSV